MSAPDPAGVADLAMQFLHERAADAGLRLVALGPGRVGLEIIGVDMPPLPVATPAHAGFVIGTVLASRAEHAATDAIEAARRGLGRRRKAPT